MKKDLNLNLPEIWGESFSMAKKELSEGSEEQQITLAKKIMSRIIFKDNPEMIKKLDLLS